MNQSSYCSMSSPAVGVASVGFSWSKRCVVKLHCVVLTCIFSMMYDVKHVFMCFFFHPYILFSKVSTNIFYSLKFFFLFLSLKNSMLFWITVLDHVSSANIFSQSVPCLLILLILSFTECKFSF